MTRPRSPDRPPSAELRLATRADHDAVDAAFGALDLADAADHARFLLAHARALTPVERHLSTRPDLPPWRSRSASLRADLAALGLAPPPPLPFAPPPHAAAGWGMLYVLEGSRLGNAVLLRAVPPGMPNSFMQARHEPGEWRRLLAAIDARGVAEGPAWREAAIAGARTCFALYARAL